MFQQKEPELVDVTKYLDSGILPADKKDSKKF